MPDNSAALAVFARDRHHAATARTLQVLRRLESDGGAVTFAGVAMAAGVSRAWLYTQPDLRAAVDDLRSGSRPTADNVPVRQQTSDASLLRRLAHAQERNRVLDQKVVLLRQQLAVAHAQIRAARALRPTGS